MANIALRTENLLDVARRMEDASNRVNNALDRLDAIMSDLDAVWSDANSKQYLMRYEALKEENFENFKSAIRSYSEFLNAVVREYRKEFTEEVAGTVN